MPFARVVTLGGHTIIGGKDTSEMATVSVEVDTGDSRQSETDRLIMTKATVKPQHTTNIQN